MMRYLLPVALGLVWIVPSCAETAADGRLASDDPDASTIPAPPGDAGCEAGMDACAPPPVEEDCAASGVAFCPVAIPNTRPSFTSVWGSRANDVWVGGSFGALMHFDGKAWVETPTNTRQTIFAVAGRPSGEVWAVSSRAVLFHSMGFAGAATWEKFEPVAQAYSPYGAPQQEALLLAAWLPPEGGVWLGGSTYQLVPPGETRAANRNLWRWGAGATSWDQSLAGTSFLVRGFWSGGPDGIWAVGGMSTAATTRYGRAIHAVPGTGALDWVEYDTQSPHDLNAVWGSSSGDVWAVGNRGAVRHWTNATPKRWAIVDVPTTEDLRAIWGTGPKDIWVVGDNGTILHYDGTTFEPASAKFGVGSFPPNLRGVWGSSADDVWIVGDSVVLHRNSGVETP